MHSTPTPPGSHSRRLRIGPWRSRGPGCRTSDSSGALFPRGPVHRRPWGRPRWPGRGKSPGVPGRYGGAWWSRAGGGGRVGHEYRAKAWAVAWTTGSFVERHGPVWPPAAPGVERSKGEGLDVKEGRRVGRENRRKGPVRRRAPGEVLRATTLGRGFLGSGGCPAPIPPPSPSSPRPAGPPEGEAARARR